MADDFVDSPEAIARGKRYLAWSAGAAVLFILAATVTAHVAQERKDRAAVDHNRQAFSLAVGADLAQSFPAMP